MILYFSTVASEDPVVWTIGNGDLMHEVLFIPHRIPRVRNGEAIGSGRHQSYGKRVVKNLEKNNVGMKEEKSLHGLTSVKDLTVKLPEDRESPYHRLK